MLEGKIAREIKSLFKLSRYSWIGASIGVVSILFFTWIYVPHNWWIGRGISEEVANQLRWTFPFHAQWSFADLLVHGAPEISVPLLFFLIGTIVAFVTPMGGVIQAGSLAAYMGGYISQIFVRSYMSNYAGYGVYLGVGSLLALVSVYCVLSAWRISADYPLRNMKLRSTARLVALLPRTVGLQR